MLRAGLQGLHLRPAEFWALSPAELALMLGATGQGGALSRAGLAALAKRWPDTPAKGEKNGGD
ncbi:putative phage protein (TIGR02216 family) [Rhodobacter aestuarii]|uniref:Phage tail assembly chaperone protein, TAC n=2 Tax=Rhodobacter aestuarii TaxID=453582 RepID=A0A1N7J658_9RHOB|nr:putative phage protein (TIGR02216 family) [Rhodobacter aestuarii]SIS44820.1 phage conserved hypothetical protein [Rhodobacter aestuarii]